MIPEKFFRLFHKAKEKFTEVLYNNNLISSCSPSLAIAGYLRLKIKIPSPLDCYTKPDTMLVAFPILHLPEH